MANGRFVSKSISTSEQLASVSLAADYLFTRCIPHLDVEGRLQGSARWIKSQIVPMRDEIAAEAIPALLEELAGACDHLGRPLVERYEVGGREFLAFPGFVAHQQGLRANRESPSKIPAPPAPAHESTPDLLRTYSGVTPELLRTYSGPTPELLRTNSRLSGREVKVSQAEAVRAREDASAPAEPSVPEAPADAPPAAPLSLREEFLRRYYAAATPRRVADVERQLDAVLAPGGCRVSQCERAVATAVTLEKALRETLAPGVVRVDDKAIVVLLRKLVSGKCNETRPPGLSDRPPGPSRRGGGGCVSLGDLLPHAPAPRLDLPPAITPEIRREAMSWVAGTPERLRAIEAWADIEAARTHPRWQEYPRMAAVRARNVEEAVVAAFQAAGASAEASVTLGSDSLAGVG